MHHLFMWQGAYAELNHKACIVKQFMFVQYFINNLLRATCQQRARRASHQFKLFTCCRWPSAFTAYLSHYCGIYRKKFIGCLQGIVSNICMRINEKLKLVDIMS